MKDILKLIYSYINDDLVSYYYFREVDIQDKRNEIILDRNRNRNISIADISELFDLIYLGYEQWSILYNIDLDNIILSHEYTGYYYDFISNYIKHYYIYKGCDCIDTEYFDDNMFIIHNNDCIDGIVDKM